MTKKTMFSLEDFHKEYETEQTEVNISGRTFRIYVPQTIDRFIDAEDVFNKFPLWAKLWEVSGVLASYLSALSVNPDKQFLELGAGLGMVGVAAASCGHNITVTEYNPHALKFVHANAQANNCKDLSIYQLDWHNPTPLGKFDYIVGSEIVYHERDFDTLEILFKNYLKSNGEIILAERLHKTSAAFFQRMQQTYQISAQKKIIRGDDQEIRMVLCRMTAK